MTILVTGATGNVGRLVVARLVEAGARVRALTRAPGRASFPGGVEVVQGDLTDPATLPAAFEGVDSVYLFPVAETAREVTRLARRAGVRRAVVLSSGAVTMGADTAFHLPVELAAQESGMEWTHVRPGEFALNKLWLWGPSIRAERVVRDPFPDTAWYPVHEADIADVAATALLHDGHAGRAYTLNGPELISHREQVGAIASAIGGEIRLEEITPERARELYLRQGGFAALNAGFLTGAEDYSGGEPDLEEQTAWNPRDLGPMPTSEQVTGQPARTFAQWAHDHAPDFHP
ncbi:SDR family oxidoreductase [Sphaerisporangium corydalis]|uniref:SDR family oxidoreductase n=1 Tax=Sphaerisporangium corydalis TaxID=1441875 RepID=A0ABV9EL21_9ACTN|nr:NAD(P)H-binding protein [Sphaerisporangium corydalis]